jgi:site-specific DNA recombinase
MSLAALPAAIYCRISNDAKGRLLGVHRQEQACRRLAEQCGWSEVEVYVDNNVSAYSGEARPAYQRMLVDLAAGRISGVVAWDADRLHRSTRELEDFIDVVESTGAPVVMVTSGHADFASATGRMHARMTGNIARYESEHKVERTTAGHASLAEAGRWKGGPRPYGYDVPRDNHGRSLRNGHLIVVPEEAAIVREAAARVLAGESIWRICTDLNARAIPTSKGTRWRTQTLRRILTNPTTVAKREYHGVIVADALWPPLLSVDDWQQLRFRIGHNRFPKHAASNDPPARARTYLLTGGIAICGKCGCNLHAHLTGAGARSYICASGPDKEGCGGVKCSAQALNALVVEAVLTRYEHPDLRTADPNADTETATEADRLQKGAAEVAGLFANGQISHQAWEVIRLGLVAVEHGGLPPNEGGPDRVLVEQWELLPLERRRQRISEILEHAVIYPTQKRGRYFDRDRVQLVWRDGDK